MIISRKRFEAEIARRVDEAVAKTQEDMWRNEHDRNEQRRIDELETRLIAAEKKCGIDHPSHHRDVTMRVW